MSREQRVVVWELIADGRHVAYCRSFEEGIRKMWEPRFKGHVMLLQRRVWIVRIDHYSVPR